MKKIILILTIMIMASVVSAADITVSIVFPDQYVAKVQAWLNEEDPTLGGANCQQFTSDTVPTVSNLQCFKLWMIRLVAAKIKVHGDMIPQAVADAEKDANKPIRGN